MNSPRKVALTLPILIVAEYVLGGLVAFDDSSGEGFAFTSFSFHWPAVLPLLHRAFALVLVASVWYMSYLLRGLAAHRYSLLTLGLIILEMVVGAFIAFEDGSRLIPIIIVVHFSISGLLIIAAAFTSYSAWRYGLTGHPGFSE